MYKLKAMRLHRVWTEYDGQVLVVDGELPESDDDAPRLLVQSLAVPVRVELVQLLLDAIVLAQPDRVLGCQTGPLIHAVVA